ncbi:hypothetical protein [Dolosigranulum pigrum]|uniref:hypothetical protein n=1 Tax=Dolosigranulum pigrum TaxID=29394 RepID=UPI001AD88EFE|nr:hypothetical protein [Dolosigranulum pigrum]QTJ54282.1 hypothetical protein FE334_00260 [Dolosigranulum pigrum]
MFKRVKVDNQNIGKIKSNDKVLFVSLRLFRTLRLKYRYNNGHLLIIEVSQSVADDIKRAKVIEINNIKYDLSGASVRYEDLWNELRIEGDNFISQLGRSRIIQYKQYNNTANLYA